MRMLRSVATVMVTGAALFGGLVTGANAAPVAASFTCGPHQVQESGGIVASYYGNCATHAVKIDVLLIYINIDPVVTDEGDRCIPAKTDALLGKNPTDEDLEYGAVLVANSC